MLVRELKEWLDKNARDEDVVFVGGVSDEGDPGLYDAPELEIKEFIGKSPTNYAVAINPC